MVDWLASMQQSFEYYIVDPGTWKDVKKLDTIKSSSISRDAETDTLGSATIDTTESLGECYIRTYLVTVQNGVTEKHPLGTHLVQTPSASFDGKTQSVTADAYTPLIELKENSPDIGFFIPKKSNIMEYGYRMTRDHLRAPVVPVDIPIDAVGPTNTIQYDFVADTDDTWIRYISDFISNAKYELDLDEMGRVLFSPKQELDSLQPVWTYTDDNSSILYPELSVNRDLFDIPNVVEVWHTTGLQRHYVRITNEDPNSPVSIQNRGREIVRRVVNPDLIGENPTEYQVNEYAKNLLKELSVLECTISYSHGYCPVRLGDCVRLNYSRAGLTDIKAKVISQSIKCTPGCPVQEKAKFTIKLWR